MKQAYKVSLIECSDYEVELVKNSLKRGLDLLGGLSKFVSQGDKVLLKPNLLDAKPIEKAVTTHPAVIEAMIQLLTEMEVEILIGDSPAATSTTNAMKKAGIMEMVNRYNVKIVDFNNPVEYSYPEGRIYRRFEVDKSIREVDKIINLAKFKTHGQMGMTLSLKNMFGSVVGIRKTQWHLRSGIDFDNFASMLLDLYHFAQPTLNIVDGVIAMEGNGPGNGTPRPLNVLLIGENALSVDRIGCELVDVDIQRVPIFKMAEQLKYPGGNRHDIELLGDDITQLQVKDFKGPKINRVEVSFPLPKFLTGYVKNASTSRPVIDNEKCTLCKKCVRNCPAKVMTLKPHSKYKEIVQIDYRNCIRCYCCQEICPDGAISLKEGWLARFIA